MSCHVVPSLEPSVYWLLLATVKIDWFCPPGCRGLNAPGVPAVRHTQRVCWPSNQMSPRSWNPGAGGPAHEPPPRPQIPTPPPPPSPNTPCRGAAPPSGASPWPKTEPRASIPLMLPLPTPAASALKTAFEVVLTENGVVPDICVGAWALTVASVSTAVDAA